MAGIAITVLHMNFVQYRAITVMVGFSTMQKL